MNDPDAVLVDAIRSGEPSRFSEVVARYDASVRAVVGPVLRDADAVEEVVQQTFYRAFRNLDGLRDPDRLEAWLRQIARRCVTDHHRKRARRRSVALRDDHAAPDPGAIWVWDEVEALTAAFREVLVLRYREGRSYAEIARRLGVPLSTVRGRLYEARRSLRRRLEDSDETTNEL